eukprot:CAMPEP_0194759938 /NCGR_PEP_ID=MMETSP0323_2-20130528/12912_1 /TAXON_ID=2866 ORGANISM="Crypthecodinium cohnii, Strain Seligo" /NCGR_SAMPLE_ID=MMETSP0323_2 /ASSEMBLY_ACC=CAM_ASM_000346 /LENGTH=69 /DNA_ID=CAMNT_0039680929 /DNA_START=674 /DNA_END=883 /DNA_ORIENTATION=-
MTMYSPPSGFPNGASIQGSPPFGNVVKSRAKTWRPIESWCCSVKASKSVCGLIPQVAPMSSGPTSESPG